MLLQAFLCVCLVAAPAAAGDLSQAQQLYREGKYDQCATMATNAMAQGYHGEEWPLLKLRCDLQRGRYADARRTLEAALKTFRFSVRLRYLGCDIYRYNDQSEKATQLREEIARLATRSTYRYGDAANRVTLGRFYSDRGADPRRVLETFYDPVKEKQPQLPDAFLAAGQLALSKSDFALAAEELESALKRSAHDPDIHHALARAYASSDAELANQHVEAALEANPRHIPTLLLLVDNRIDAERYGEAREYIAKVLEINPRHPEAWAYRAVLAHLDADPQREREARRKALASWSENPRVDHLIGRKLSQKYRFEEGAQYQRRALAFDSSCLPAQIQLAQDLLRLGKVEEGWRRAETVFDRDAYNVVAHNLVQLKASMSRFATLENDDFIVRMDATEAAVYGGRVLELLGRAKEELCGKYEVSIDERVTVEIFPRQQDFAIRTFGLPGGEGFLGVCFGRVITANSPASQSETPTNLDSVLWHEFCHVVTLQKTRNRMPRWLSEGISVYEEKQADPSWGQSMNPLYRKMIAAGQLTPVSELSGAFLRPPSPLHLQFAYYQSSMVVQYLVEEYGRQVLNRILTDLGAGMPINESLQRYTGSLDALNVEFEQYARERAAALAPAATWEDVELAETAGLDELAAWIERHPNSFEGLRRYALQLIQADRLEEAEDVVERFVNLCPSYAGRQSGYAMQATICRKRGDVSGECEALEARASRQSDAVQAYLRLMELGKKLEDWEQVSRNADRMLAVNPLVPTPHRFRAAAAEHQKDSAAAVASYQALLEMEPADPARLHFRLAHHLHRMQRDPQALRHALMALEEAPRYREAHRLLLELLPASRQVDSPPTKAGEDHPFAGRSGQASAERALHSPSKPDGESAGPSVPPAGAVGEQHDGPGEDTPSGKPASAPRNDATEPRQESPNAPSRPGPPVPSSGDQAAACSTLPVSTFRPFAISRGAAPHIARIREQLS